MLPTDRFGKETFVEQPQMGGECDREWITEDLGLLSDMTIDEELDHITAVLLCSATCCENEVMTRSETFH
ncbi:hypothetical protein FYJ85_06555 [Victivallaceae bacterium BBE-744-WT-12]|uniref:Uncharacterized protein n=1 Tax=Victivallis lenta TaxID=2606640 RepID=A0A844G167_9BACT|nr:hypothetical protein [Victivallis lenta]MST96704.1 hypothetical protein [Victivallis lenta]